jgi:hypothetical protein
VHLQCLYARAAGLALRAGPDAAGAAARSISRKSELDRFLLPVDPHWHGNESAVVRTIRIQIPG